MQSRETAQAQIDEQLTPAQAQLDQALASLVLGVFLEGFVITTAEVDQVMLGRDIHPLSFILSFALTALFTALVTIAMRGKLRKVDMVESLNRWNSSRECAREAVRRTERVKRMVQWHTLPASFIRAQRRR